MASGGSTGRPKLIEVGSDSRVDLGPFGQALGAKDEDTQLVSVPMSHNTGMMAAAMGLTMGHHIVLMPRFEPGEFLRLVAEQRIDWLFTVPTIMQRLLAVYDVDPAAHDLSSIRQIGHVGAPCPPSVKQRWIEILGPDALWEVYGGTETQAFTVISGRDWLTHRGSVGKVAGGEMKVLDDDGRECPPGVSGEVFMRPAPGNPPAYRYIGATAKTRDGWDTLGDLGYFDSDGYLYLNDRRVDMFTVGGRNVYPAEIEGALSAHRDVLSCLVVGVPDDDLGQVPYAIVEANGLDEASVIAFLADRIAGYKLPRTVEFTTTPLRDDAGKARRSAVRDGVIARLTRADI
jgi:bile acid-coenzyme A ligase